MSQSSIGRGVYVSKVMQYTFFTAVVLFIGAVLVGLSSKTAIWLQVHLGYYFSLSAFIAWSWFMLSFIRKVDYLSYCRAHWPGLLIGVFAGLSLQFFQESKIRNYEDEPKQLIIAQSMHERRQVSRPQVGYYLEGQMTYGAQRIVGPEMYFYPFLVSLVHDLTGYRVENGWAVNAAVAVVLFLFVYTIGSFLHPRGGGLLAVMLAAGVPLLDLAASSYGNGLVNVTYLALLFIVSIRYVHHPAKEELGLFLTTTLILALIKGESAFYLMYTIGIIAAMRFKRKKIPSLSWFVPVFILLITPVIVALKLNYQSKLVKDPVITILDYITTLFDTPEHLLELGAWMLNLSEDEVSFSLLSFLGIIGFVTLITTIVISLIKRKCIKSHNWLLLYFAVVVWGTYLITLTQRDSDSSVGKDISSLLPLQLLFLILTLWWFQGLKVSARFTQSFLLIVGVVIFVFGVPSRMSKPRGNNEAFIQHADWARTWLSKNDDRETLYMTPLYLTFLLYDYATIDWRLAQSKIMDLMQLVREGYYDSIVGFVIERYDFASDTWVVVYPSKPMSQKILTRDIDERRYAYNTRARFFTIEGYTDNEGFVIRPNDLEYLKERDYENAEEYINLMQLIHPSYR